jgi:hypothetical protein
MKPFATASSMGSIQVEVKFHGTIRLRLIRGAQIFINPGFCHS